VRVVREWLDSRLCRLIPGETAAINHCKEGKEIERERENAIEEWVKVKSPKKSEKNFISGRRKSVVSFGRFPGSILPPS
jgi:hypothetical protein